MYRSEHLVMNLKGRNVPTAARNAVLQWIQLSLTKEGNKPMHVTPPFPLASETLCQDSLRLSQYLCIVKSCGLQICQTYGMLLRVDLSQYRHFNLEARNLLDSSSGESIRVSPKVV